MPLHIIRNDITQVSCDAIVNAANPTLQGGGGVDGAIHRAAGKGLWLECRQLGGCDVGDAKITGGYRLPCRYVIHTVGPRWQGGSAGEEQKLESCYRKSLQLALSHQCESIAFPLISSGVYGYPKDQALKIALRTIQDFLLEQDMTVYLVIFDRASYQISEKLFTDIQSYIDDHYAARHTDAERERMRRQQYSLPLPEAEPAASDSMGIPDEAPLFAAAPPPGLDEMLNRLDESFSQMLLRKIDEKGMKDSACYKKANIDRKLFSKIRSDVGYRPSKTTAIAFAIALELSLEETKDMLRKAGFALSHSNKFDIIIEYFITNGNYDIFEINEALFAFDQSLLG